MRPSLDILHRRSLFRFIQTHFRNKSYTSQFARSDLTRCLRIRLSSQFMWDAETFLNSHWNSEDGSFDQGISKDMGDSDRLVCPPCLTLIPGISIVHASFWATCTRVLLCKMRHALRLRCQGHKRFGCEHHI